MLTREIETEEELDELVGSLKQALRNAKQGGYAGIVIEWTLKLKGIKKLLSFIGKESFVVGGSRHTKYKELIEKHAYEMLPDHIGHTLEFQEDSPHLLWIKCLDCNKLWTHCDFCQYGLTHVGSLDFNCPHKCSKPKEYFRI